MTSSLTSFHFVRPLVKCEAGNSHECIRRYSSVEQYELTALYINSLYLELYLNQWLEDEPCMAIHVPSYLPVIAVEYITTVMGCCMSSN